MPSRDKLLQRFIELRTLTCLAIQYILRGSDHVSSPKYLPCQNAMTWHIFHSISPDPVGNVFVNRARRAEGLHDIWQGHTSEQYTKFGGLRTNWSLFG